MRHLLLTPERITLRRAFPWSYSIERMLWAQQSELFSSNHLMFGSDYGGDHKESQFKTYCFLIAEQRSTPWLSLRQSVRDEYLKDGRRLSFKKLNDHARRRALAPFLDAANYISGHLIGLAVDKRFKWMSTGASSFDGMPIPWLKARWNPRSFEEMARKAHVLSLCLSLWAKPGIDVTWITDEDDFVANPARLDDAHKWAAILSSLYVNAPLGVFAMNTTRIDAQSREFEDFVAIPDLAAGMLAEVCTALSRRFQHSSRRKNKEVYADALYEFISEKSQLISDWFWWDKSPLKRSCIIIEQFDEHRYEVRNLHLREKLLE